MNRYINSADALNTLKHLAYETALNQHVPYVRDVFEDIAKNRLETWVGLIPTADVVDKGKYDRLLENSIIISEALRKYQDAEMLEREHGKWTEKEVIHAEEAKEVITEWQSCRCSVCGRYDTRPYMYYFDNPNYCSWCGADMRKGANDAEIH